MSSEVNLYSGSGPTPDQARIERLSLGIQELLDICAEKGVEVPDELRNSLLATLEEHRLASQADFIAEKHKECKDSIANLSIVDDLLKLLKKLKVELPLINVRVKNGSYKVVNYYTDEIKPFRNNEVEDPSAPRRAKQKVKTVKTESPIYKLFQCLLRFIVNGDLRQRAEEKVIMDGVNLALESGKMYLILGAPGCGKSTLLKMIANSLHKSKDHTVGGEIFINGISPDKDVVWTNLAGYIDQIDRLHPFLTVYETCYFAWMCRSGGTHRKKTFGEGPEVDETVRKMDSEAYTVNKILEGLGLTRVRDTFVGDQTRVRGVSGGEKKRVTLAEMLTTQVPVLCCDEISTGLDAATTFDITRLMGAVNKITNTLKVFSLLQPPPETVANFDELILLSEGKIIYCGPVDEVIQYFGSLGYEIPERMDLADWLQTLPTSEGWQFLKDATYNSVGKSVLVKKHLSTEEFHQKFYESELGQAILSYIDSPNNEPNELLKSVAKVRYANSTFQSFKLLVQRELLLWRRDTYQIRMKLTQTFIMGIVVGTLFFQSSENSANIVAVLFQSLMYTIVGAMGVVIKQFPDRSIFYKQQDANFFPTWTYVAGRSIAAIPNALIDGCVYGTMIFFLVGMAFSEGASIANYFIFMLLLFVSSLTSGLFFSVFPAIVQSVTIAQAGMAIVAVLFVVFSGFTVQPDVIPDYYIWLYYINFCAWGLRALIVNEFDSGKYDDVPLQANPENRTTGELILLRFGFKDRDGEPFTSAWTWWGFLFIIGSAILAVLSSSFLLNNVRFATGQTLVTDQGDDYVEEVQEDDVVEIPFKKADLTFKNIHYKVVSSITNEKIELLKGVDGILEAGKMTALMGSSGAGKTTLMDVLALRKTTGELEGEVTVNGHPQEESSFRRCTGYVEQFDTQTPQLTIRETLEFSAQLRLDATDPAITEESKRRFIDQTLSMLELTNIQDLQVGSDSEGGLSFEQRKRLSIGVELVSNPSIIFLDEPTSGLDARAAMIVMRGMKRIALSGRAICATIHQPSVAIFNGFDSLLLLKRGGEVVFFGELGHDSSNLISYLERYEATPRIQPGENPATWMLTTIGAGSASTTKQPFDFSGYYAKSRLRADCLARIDLICANRNPEGKVMFTSQFATSYSVQANAVFFRALKVYFRSPNYNVTRIVVSAVVALLFGSVYASQRVPQNESDMNSRFNSVFIAVVFLCVNAQNSVLSVFEFERNMFYKHRAAGMYRPSAVARAFTLAEVPFIITGATVFVVTFYFIMGFAVEADKFFIFYIFCMLSFAAFTFNGQMFVALFRDSETAQGFGGLVVSMTSMFGGILLKPSDIPNFWIFMYWIFPGHYIFEGIFMSQFDGDETKIEASFGSPFFLSLPECRLQSPCHGTAEQWVTVNFEDWSRDNVKWNILYLVFFIVATRVITVIALARLDYRAN